MTITERDEKGRIVKRELSSEEAKEMAAKRHSKTVDAKQEDVLALIQEAGYSNIDEAPRALRIVCEEVADKGSRSIAAVVQYRQLTSINESATSVVAPRPGEECLVCGSMNLRGLKLDKVAVDAVIANINNYCQERGFEPDYEMEFKPTHQKSRLEG